MKKKTKRLGCWRCLAGFVWLLSSAHTPTSSAFHPGVPHLSVTDTEAGCILSEQATETIQITVMQFSLDFKTLSDIDFLRPNVTILYHQFALHLSYVAWISNWMLVFWRNSTPASQPQCWWFTWAMSGSSCTAASVPRRKVLIRPSRRHTDNVDAGWVCRPALL